MTMEPGHTVTSADIEPYPFRTRIARDTETAQTVLLVANPVPMAWHWVLTQYHVNGWTCLAGGTVGREATTNEEVAAIVAEEYGNGFDHLPRERYGLLTENGAFVHIRRITPANIGAYCGDSITRPYDPAATRGRYMQHCTQCTTTYRAENYGRCPVEA